MRPGISRQTYASCVVLTDACLGDLHPVRMGVVDGEAVMTVPS